jgi:hypothetical protein
LKTSFNYDKKKDVPAAESSHTLWSLEKGIYFNYEFDGIIFVTYNPYFVDQFMVKFFLNNLKA